MGEDGSGLMQENARDTANEITIKTLEHLLRGLENGSIELMYFNLAQSSVETTPPEAQDETRALTGERHIHLGVRSNGGPVFTEREPG